MTQTTPKGPRGELLILCVAGFHLLFLLDTLVDCATGGVSLEADFSYIYLTGERLLSGNTDNLYASDGSGMFWRYPPFCLYPAALASLLPLAVAFTLQGVLQLGGTLASYALLRPKALVLVLVLGLTSAPFAETIGAGQNSGLILAVITLGSVLWARGHSVWGGLVLGLLCAKPNWGIPFGVFALATRDFKAAGTMLATALVLMISSIPLGLHHWQDFIHAVSRGDDQYSVMTENGTMWFYYSGNKLIHLWGLFQNLPSLPGQALWYTCVALMIGALVILARRSDRLHQLAGVTLFTVAANPYAFFYDALVLIFPALIWWNRRTHSRAWKCSGVLILGVWFSTQFANQYPMLLSLEPAPFALTGLLVTLWLGCEALDAGHSTQE
jgi:hypothetical protein